MRKNQLTVWHLNSNRWMSAITDYAISSAVSLNQAGYKNVFSPLKNSPGEIAAKKMAINVTPLRTFSLGGFLEFLNLKRVIKPDVIICYGGPETFLAMLFAKNTKIIRFIGQNFENNFYQNWRTRLAYWRVHHFILPSQVIADQLKKSGIGPHTVVVLGRDPAIFFRRDTPSQMLLSKRPEIMIFGRFDPIKGHEYAITLFKKMLDIWDIPEKKPCLHLVGEPQNISEAQIKEWIMKSGLIFGEDVLITVGRVADVSATLSGATLGWVPSLDSEIICRVAEEFLLCGVPLLVSGVGSLEDVLFPEAGVSYRQMQTDDQITLCLAASVKRSINEEDITKKQRASKARELFSYQRMGKVLVEIIETVFKKQN